MIPPAKEYRRILRHLLKSVEVRTNFGHLRHDNCTPAECDVLFREKAIEDARKVMA